MGMPDGVTRSPDELAADAVGRDVAVRARLRMRSRLMIRQEALIPSERSRPSFRASGASRGIVRLPVEGRPSLRSDSPTAALRAFARNDSLPRLRAFGAPLGMTRVSRRRSDAYAGVVDSADSPVSICDAASTSLLLPINSGVRWWSSVGLTSRIRCWPSQARPPACSTTNASGFAS